MRVRNLSNSVKRNDEKNTVNSWRLGYSSTLSWQARNFSWNTKMKTDIKCFNQGLLKAILKIGDAVPLASQVDEAEKFINLISKLCFKFVYYSSVK